MKNLAKLFGLFKDKKFRRGFILFVILILIASGVFIYIKKEGRVSIEDSLVQAPVTSITSSAPGTLNEIDVTENQSVKKGDLLAVVGTQSLRAPTDGIIISANRSIGSTITTASNVVQLINPDDFRIVGTIDENKGLKDIRVGQIASFTVDAFPGQTFWGYVDEVSPTARQTQATFSISSTRPTQQFDVLVRFDSTKLTQLKNGMSAKLTIYTKTS